MDSGRTKRRSFTKSKLIKSIYRAAKPSAAQPPYTTKSPKPTAAYSSPAPIEFGVAYPANRPKPAPSSAAAGFIIMNQEQIFPQPTPKVSFVVAERNRGLLENFYGGAAAEDEGVDAKAAEYISNFYGRLERINSERKNFQDIVI